VDIHVARFAFQSLMKQAIQQGTAVITESGARVTGRQKLVLANSVTVMPLVHSGTFERHKLVTSLVDHKGAGHALKTL
jgi:hypothetical protein